MMHLIEAIRCFCRVGSFIVLYCLGVIIVASILLVGLLCLVYLQTAGGGLAATWSVIRHLGFEGTLLVIVGVLILMKIIGGKAPISGLAKAKKQFLADYNLN